VVRRNERLEKIFWNTFPFIVVILVWQAIASMKLFPQYLFPDPASVLNDFVSKGLYSNELLINVNESLIRLFTGYAIGISSGIAMGIAMGLSRPISKFFDPLIRFGNAIPPIAWLPIAILWLGIGFKTVVFVILLVVFFPVLYGTSVGLKTMSTKFSNVASMYGGSKWQLIAYVLLPGALPSIVNGIRIGAAYGWRGLIATEMISGAAGAAGIGWMIIDARAWLNTETVILSAIIIGILWISIDRIILKTLESKTIEKWGMINEE
jgi:NitT/TauT family transport system permease protein/taurine transport system permease protein